MTPEAAQDAADDMPLYAASAKVYPQSVKGPFRRLKWALLGFCLAVYYILPFIRWDRGEHLPNQAVMVDFERKRLYFFFIELWPQEVYYLTGLLVLAALILFLMNAVAGRLWCGYLCPQTVWTDLFQYVERVFEGDRRERMQRDAGKLTSGDWARKIGKHFVWLMIAWWTGGAWVLYFGDAFQTVKDLATFNAPFTTYLWIGILTFTTYALAGHLREQVCLYMCPWPRIQAALTDTEALNVTYRYDRGEPRMSVKQAAKVRAAQGAAGDCVDCNQCVAVCPTGVDIRQGPSLGCIQCGICIDACDNIMTKINRPTGLIGYDTVQAVEARAAGKPAPAFKIVRARTILYVAIIVFVGGAMLYQLATRSFLNLGVIHDRAPLYTVLRDGSIRNAYTLRIGNKRTEDRLVAITLDAPAGTASTDWRPIVRVPADSTIEVRLLVSMPKSQAISPSRVIQIKASDLFFGETTIVQDNFFAP
jgi:cytochrome c oxidase accessory protein FixG